MFNIDMEYSIVKLCQCSGELGFSNVKKKLGIFFFKLRDLKLFLVFSEYMNIKKDEETGDAKARLKRISCENNLQGVSKESEQQ